MSESWRLDVDGRACIASGMCAALAPELFELTADHARPVDASIEPDEIALDAADSCPASAITVRAGGVAIGPRP